ncbi:hypothetical protein [Rhizobium arsenicireducens]
MIENDFLDSLELSNRARNVLRNADLTTPQIFYNLTRTHVMTLRGAGRRTWLEIEEHQIKLRRETKMATVPGQALTLIRALNDLPLAYHGYFITKNSAGRLRLGRYFNKEDFDGLE